MLWHLSEMLFTIEPVGHHTALPLVWCYLRLRRVLCLRHIPLADVLPFRHHTALPLVWCYLR